MSNPSTALVTGANRGMGLACSRALAEQGFHVLMASRQLKVSEEFAKELRQRGFSAEAVQLDVTSQADIDVLAAKIEADSGSLEVLINNAGILIDGAGDASSSILEARAEVVLQSFQVNTLGPVMLINTLLPALKKATQARIVNISSGMGQLSDMGGHHPGYRISKTALNAVTCIYAAELGTGCIAINSVCPGWVRTDMGGANADRSLEQGIDTAIWLATSADISNTGGFYRDRQLIDW